MRGWQILLLIAVVLGQTPAVGWREAFSRPRCDVAVCKCRDCAERYDPTRIENR